jgi:hypothetical protein
MTKTIVVLFLLSGCTYRYDTASFVADSRPETPVQAAREPIPCPEAKSTIEVKNTLDNKTNTITTTATSTHSQVDPCFQ